MEETETYINNDLGLLYLNGLHKLKIEHIDALHAHYTDADIK